MAINVAELLVHIGFRMKRMREHVLMSRSKCRGVFNMLRKVDNKWNVEYDGNKVLQGVTFWANTTNGMASLELKKQVDSCTPNKWSGKLLNADKDIEGQLGVEEREGTLLFSVELQIHRQDITQILDFASKNCFVMSIENMSDMEQCLAGAMGKNLWWMTPYFSTKLEEIPGRTQNLLLKRKETYTVYLPMPTEEGVVELEGTEKGVQLGCSLYREGGTKIRGTFLAVHTEKNPYTCIENLYKTALLDKFPLRQDRKYPERLRYFGFCSWDAFYTDVSAAGLEEKLQELKAKGIPIHWLLIDDGWMQVKERKLCSFKEDDKKFPEGLKGFIEKVKKEYGVEKVGVWHSLQGYWHGIEPYSELFCEKKENLVQTAAGYWVPAWEEGKAFGFWNAWHDYLKKQGVDFVKVDNQGGSSEYARNNVSISKAARAVLRGLEASVLVNFGGDILHCMGMGQAEYLGRWVTGVTRSSDDFFPKRLDGFKSHVMQNAYNSYFHGPIYWCDWDMWWTKHPTAVQSAVLRAISGGPVYVSDKIGDTEAEQLLPLMEMDGRILMCDAPGRPVLSQLMGVGENDIFQIWNTCEGQPVVAAFDLNNSDSARNAVVCCKEVLQDTREYVAYAALTKKFYRVNKNDTIQISLVNGAEILNFYPIENESIYMGDREKYVSLASREKKWIDLSELFEA